MDKNIADQNGWIDIREARPEDMELVLVWNNRKDEPCIQVYNEEYYCWDTEDGDDFEYGIDETTNDGRLVISHWQSLPKRPEVLQ